MLSALKNRPRLSGALLGAGVTVVSSLLFFSINAFQRPELQAFDARVLLFNTIEANDAIVHVDIDDGSLEEIGRWPWPRRRLAELVGVLAELDAAVIMIDLLLSEPERRYFDDPRLGRDADIEGDVAVVGALSQQNEVFGDLELAEAIRSAGNVIMSVQLETLAPGEAPPLHERIARLDAKADETLSVTRVIEALGLEDVPAVRTRIRRELLRRALDDVLAEDFTLGVSELADRLGVDVTAVETVLAGAKRMAAARLVSDRFASGSVPALEDVRATILGEERDRNSADRRDIHDAYRAALGLRVLHKAVLPWSASMSPRVHETLNAAPLYYEFADAALDIAAVNFRPDDDGTVRRVPPLIRYDGGVIQHLGFAVAAHVLDLDVDHISMPDARTLRIPRRGGGVLNVPLDGDGNMIIPWTSTGKNWREGADFAHIPAAKLLSISDARRRIRDNETTINYLLADVVAASKGTLTVVSGEGDAQNAKVVSADQAYRQRVNEQLDLAARIRLARLRRNMAEEQMAELGRRSDALLARIKQDQEVAVSVVEMNCGQLDAIPPAEIENDPELKLLAARFGPAGKLIREDIARLREANSVLAMAVDREKAALADHIGGKYVFVGFAATAQGDIVTTPIDKSTNGVMCHANVLNGFLQGRFITRGRLWIEIGVCLLLGVLVSVVTSVRGPRAALLGTLILIVFYSVVNALLGFRLYDLWFAVTAVGATLFLAWAFVTLFRQLTAERDKRLFRKQLSQYTSPAIAERIAESPEAAQAFKAVQTRDMTCFFSDLKGFTSITESEDAGVVQHVLNTYLEKMSRVIWSHRGLINKFMGDGIMAFFNPSVDPLPEHIRVSCETALDVFEALDQLKEAQAGSEYGRIFQQLEMRVGIATGVCKNGDLGSELKADYTVIGDVVNLAARLEPANKVFGTRIMISGAARDAVQEDYEFRYLADLQVKGKKKTVPAYEIICRRGELDEAGRTYVEAFEAGVALYKQRQWDECIVHFARLLSKRFDDLGASRYIDACQEFKQFPPNDNWNGALELKEK